MTKEMNQIIDAVEAAYIKVMGAEKWNSLTDRQKHNVVMILVRDMNKTLDKI